MQRLCFPFMKNMNGSILNPHLHFMLQFEMNLQLYIALDIMGSNIFYAKKYFDYILDYINKLNFCLSCVCVLKIIIIIICIYIISPSL
jgi:hypothetical protein